MKRPPVLPILCGLGCALPVQAVCRVPQPRSVCAEYSHSTLVAEATLTKIDSRDSYDNDPAAARIHIYTLRIDRMFRGKPQSTIRIYEENSSGRASFAWKIGTEYLLFLFDPNDQPDPGLFELDGCGNSGPVAGAESVVSQIQQAQNRRAALITGRVTGARGYPLVDPFPNVEVVARSATGTYKGETDRKGEFLIAVPAGNYVVKPVRSGLSFDPYDLSYENPDDLSMKPASCAQVQFVGRSRY